MSPVKQQTTRQHKSGDGAKARSRSAQDAKSAVREPKLKAGSSTAKAAGRTPVKKLPSPTRMSAATKALADAVSNWSQFLKNGGVDPLKISRDLGITKSDLAETLGLPADALVRDERIRADKTQARLSELLEILTRVEPWSGGLRSAFAWYRSQGIPALGDATAESMVKTNRAALVRTYLDGVAAGGFA